MESLIAVFMAPVRQFLQEQGLWEQAVSVYQQGSHIWQVLMHLVTTNFGIAPGNLSGIFVGLLKLVVNITVAVFQALFNIINWILGFIR